MDIDQLLSIYFTNQATKEQRKTVEAWRDSNEKNAGQFELIQMAWRTKPNPKTYINREEAGERIWRKYNSERSLIKKSFGIGFIIRAAAVLLFMATFAFLIFRESGTKVDSIQVVEKKTNIKSNPSGVKSTIRLPDGSSVVLNSESTISYKFEQNDSVREVELSGEAFFKIKREARRPFIVRSGNVATQVLGTEFNVKAFPAEDNIDIALLEGKIKVIAPSDKNNFNDFFLEPGQGFRFNKSDQSGIIEQIDFKEKFGWKNGTLYFRNNTLEEVIAKLSRWYGVKFELANYSNQKWDYSGEYQDEYLEVILESMRFSEHFTYEIDNELVKIYFN
ncbi:MAG: FecR domain-containing protein [Cytophagales bacterium]|nr:FecR domain-containing protein [Cytophagales bacterium]